MSEKKLDMNVDTIMKRPGEKKSMRRVSHFPRVRYNTRSLTWGGNCFNSSWNSSAHSPHGYKRDVRRK